MHAWLILMFNHSINEMRVGLNTIHNSTHSWSSGMTKLGFVHPRTQLRRIANLARSPTPPPGDRFPKISIVSFLSSFTIIRGQYVPREATPPTDMGYLSNLFSNPYLSTLRTFFLSSDPERVIDLWYHSGAIRVFVSSFFCPHPSFS